VKVYRQFRRKFFATCIPRRNDVRGYRRRRGTHYVYLTALKFSSIFHNTRRNVPRLAIRESNRRILFGIRKYRDENFGREIRAFYSARTNLELVFTAAIWIIVTRAENLFHRVFCSYLTFVFVSTSIPILLRYFN